MSAATVTKEQIEAARRQIASKVPVTRKRLDLGCYLRPSSLVPGALELTSAGEVLAERVLDRQARVLDDYLEARGDERLKDLAEALWKEQLELEDLYCALTHDTVPGAHGAVLPGGLA